MMKSSKKKEAKKTVTSTTKKLKVITTESSSGEEVSVPGFQRVAIVYRIHTPQAVAMARKVAQWLIKRDIEVFTAPEQKVIAGTKMMANRRGFAKVNLIVVLGGDGTYLRAVRMLEGKNIPVLGFNMGSLGFLTSHTSDEVFDLLQQTLDGKMAVQKRVVINTRVFKKRKLVAEIPALNDVVIERGSHSQLISTGVYSDRFLVSQIKADGLVVSTPTGSTAYNLAAGGPIMHPETKAFIVTPVSPHSLTSRPLIFPDDRRLSFKLDTPNIKALLIVDGQKVLDMGHEHEIEIRKCDYEHLMLREPKHNFFHLLREKLKFGIRN